MRDELISIIIPVYNSEKYIVECLESVLTQSYKKIEIIIVNDGSTDRSLEICKHFAQNDNRIVIINQENQGQSMARNNGANHASGNYVFFLDSDDLLQINAIQRMSEELRCDSEIVVCNYKRFSNAKQVDSLSGKNTNTVKRYSRDEYIKEILLLEKNTYAWGILINKEIVITNPFPKGRFFEDLATVPRYLLSVTNVVYIQEELVKYRVSDLSIVSHMNNTKLEDYLFAAKNMLHDIDTIESIGDEYTDVFMGYVYLQLYNYQELINDKVLINECVSFLEKKSAKILKTIKISNFACKLFLWKYLRHIYDYVLRMKKHDR